MKTIMTEDRRKIALLIEYDGTGYSGWQSQPNSATVQDRIEEALEKLTGEKPRLHGSGRTDAGVHARGQVGCFQTTRPYPPKAFRDGLNTFLPEDIRILSVAETAAVFDPRRQAIRRTYTYRLINRRVHSAIDRRVAAHIARALDFEAIAEVSKCFLGEKNFAGYRSSQCSATRTTLTLEELSWARTGQGEWTMTIACRSFLHSMIRVIVGSLIEVGKGRFDQERIEKIFETGDRTLAGKTAPPEGLTLEKVEYPEHISPAWL